VTPEPTLQTLVTVEAPLQAASLATLLPYAVALLVVVVVVLLVLRRSR
jgi:hypothetical protein